LKEHNGDFRDNGRWEQNGNQIYTEINNKYSEGRGTFESDKAEGIGWNSANAKWVYIATPFHYRKHVVRKNRSEQPDGELSVHVFKVSNSTAPMRKNSGGYGFSVNGLVPELVTIKPRDGFTFLTLVFGTESKSRDFTLSMKQVDLEQTNGQTFEAVNFYDADFKKSLVGYTAGGKGSPATGPFGVSFEVPTNGLSDLVFKVSGTVIGSIKEFTE
jgi:hypothetical protein